MRRPEPRTVFVGATLALLVAGIAASQIVPEIRKRLRAPVFTAVWSSMPTSEDVVAIYPDAAREAGFKGDVEVDLRCYIDKDFGIDGCSVARESPAGYGFGEATLKLTPKFKLDAKVTRGEALVGYRMIIPVRFKSSPTPFDESASQ